MRILGAGRPAISVPGTQRWAGRMSPFWARRNAGSQALRPLTSCADQQRDGDRIAPLAKASVGTTGCASAAVWASSSPAKMAWTTTQSAAGSCLRGAAQATIGARPVEAMSSIKIGCRPQWDPRSGMLISTCRSPARRMAKIFVTQARILEDVAWTHLRVPHRTSGSSAGSSARMREASPRGSSY